MSLYSACQEKGKEYSFLRSELSQYISKFFLEKEISVTVEIIPESPIIKIFYKPHRNECYILQKDSFYRRLDELLNLLDLRITYKESRCWSFNINMPYYHKEIVHLREL